MERVSFADTEASETADLDLGSQPKYESLDENIGYLIPKRDSWTIDDWLDYYGRCATNTEGYTYSDDEDE